MAGARSRTHKGTTPAGLRKGKGKTGTRGEGITFTTVDGAKVAPGIYVTERLDKLNLLPSGTNIKAFQQAIDMMFESPNLAAPR